MTHYTPEQIDILLNCYFRHHPRPMPYQGIAEKMGVDNPGALDDIVWKVITGYGGKRPADPRRVYTPTTVRINRAGSVWLQREVDALQAALAGAGQLRAPPCDLAYIAAVLARDESEVEAKWGTVRDPLHRGAGFGIRR